MTGKNFELDTEQRPFTIIYHDFFESSLLSMHGKMIFIALKTFADSNNQCFPSVKLLAELTGMGKTTVNKALTELVQKGVISKKNRIRKDGGKTSNFYTLYDYSFIWNTCSSPADDSISADDSASADDTILECRLIEELQARGYMVTKKELDSAPAKKQNQELDKLDKSYIPDTHHNTESSKSQDVERYTLNDLREFFDYDAMIIDNPCRKDDIDSVMDIIYTAVNSTKPAIRVACENKPVPVVIGRLMKLKKESIIYSIEKFSQQTERIKQPVPYMLTILYNAPEQYILDIRNQASHDMTYGWKDQTSVKFKTITRPDTKLGRT